MPQKVLDYLNSEHICVVALEMPDGSPHAATVHFAFNKSAIAFIIQTSPNYRKSTAILNREYTRASIVVGMVEHPEGKDKTFQLDGEARLLKPTDELVQVYLNKFPKKDRKFADDIFFAVIPTWWRFTEWGTPKGKVIVTSDNK